jgi:hypothetical protein
MSVSQVRVCLSGRESAVLAVLLPCLAVVDGWRSAGIW